MNTARTLSCLFGLGLVVGSLFACSSPEAPISIPGPSAGSSGDGKTTVPEGTNKNTDPNKKTEVVKPGDPSKPPAGPNATPPNGAPAPPGDPADPGGNNGEPGQPGRISVNEHCCFGGKYFKCPDSNACFGGFDVGACLDNGNCGPGDPCWDECFSKLDNAGPPKGCDGNAPEPNNVDCANGNIGGN